jgi:hypothetical protein
MKGEQLGAAAVTKSLHILLCDLTILVYRGVASAMNAYRINAMCQSFR